RAWPELVQRRRLIQPAVLHYLAQCQGIADILQRVPLEHDQVSVFSGLDGAELILPANGLGGADRGGAQHFAWRHTARSISLHLPVIAETRHLSMTPHTQQPARTRDLRSAHGDAWKQAFYRIMPLTH